MKYSSKTKSIFINMLLIIAMITSIIGGAFLLLPNKNATAAEVIDGKPADIKFAAKIEKGQQVNEYTADAGYSYESSSFNYVTLNNLVYYVHANKLYTDATHKMIANDVTADSITATKVTGAHKNIADADKVDYNVYKDRYSVEHNGLRYFLKDGNLYTDIACTKIPSLFYDIIYDVDGTTTLPGRNLFADGNNYYQISGTSTYINADGALNNIYNNSLNIMGSATSITPTYVYIFEGNNVPAISQGVNRYVTLGGNRYYIYDNKLYTTEVFNMITGTALDDLIGSYSNGIYSDGYVFRGQSSMDVLYVVSNTTQTATDGITYNQVKNVNGNGRNYYVNLNEPLEGKLYSITGNVASEISSTSLDFNVKQLTQMDIDGDNTNENYLVATFTYNNANDVKTSFYLSGSTYYIINNNICTKNTITECTVTQGFYQFANTTRTFTIDKNNVNILTIGSFDYYPIQIFGNMYYIRNDSLYSVTRNAAGTYTATVGATPADCGCSAVNITTSNNIISVTITYTAKYLMRYNNVHEVNPVNLAHRNSFICYSDTYFYENNVLYLNGSHSTAVSDFNYSCEINNVLVDGIYHNISETELEYVVINGKTFYINQQGTLYSKMTLGGDELFNFENSYKVENTPFAYKVNSAQGIITMFDGLQISAAIDTSDTRGGAYVGTVEYGGIKYYVSTTLELTYIHSNGASYNFYELNFDYKVTHSSTGIPNKITIKGTDYNLTPAASGVYQLSSTLNGKSAFYYYLTTPTVNNGLYYNTGMAGYSPANHIRVSKGYESFVKNGEIVLETTVVSYSDYIVVDTDNTTPAGGIAQDTVYFADSYRYTGTSFEYNVNGEDLTFTISGSNLSYKGLDASYKFMDYEYNSATGEVKIKQKYDSLTTSFNSFDAYSHKESFQYIDDISNDKFYIIRRDGNALGLYKTVSLDTAHAYSYGGASNKLNANFKANSVHVNFQPASTYYDIQNNSGLEYKDIKLMNPNDNIASGEVALLNNYLHKNTLLTTTNSAGIDVFYIGFNEKHSDGSIPTIVSGVHNLTVQAYLNNDYVMKYKNISSSYYIDNTGKAYGILLDINPIVEEEVNYQKLVDNVNVNHYWYNYFDLANLNALVSFNNDASGTYRKERIEETSGLYSFIFQFTYINNGISTQHIFTYSVYITESSKYIEAPSFNTQLTLASENGTTGYYEVVQNYDTSLATSAYSFNNETYDVPIYTYDASKYNVKYDVKYNIEQHFYTTDFVLVNAGGAGEYGILSVYKNTILQDTYVLNKSTKYEGTSKYQVVHYTKNGLRFGALCITPNGDYLLSLENFYYYNQNNFDTYGNELDYLKNGRLIKNGAKNTPSAYYMVLVFEELGDYTFENKYLVSNGSSTRSSSNGTFKELPDTVSNTFYGSYSEVAAVKGKIFNSEVLRYGTYGADKEFLFDTGFAGLAQNDQHPNSIITPATTSLKYYGIETKFVKTTSEIRFRKIDSNIYSDVSPNSQLITQLRSILSSHDGKTLSFEGKPYNIPLTNLQPIYFDYFGSFDYARSYYYRFENCTYNVESANGLLKSIEFRTGVVSKSTINFTNKTTISAPGFYIVEVKYGPTGSNIHDTQLFAFVIDNSAPNLEIYTADEDLNETLFISSTQFSTTTRYTNAPYLKAKWAIPNYFQGQVGLSYQRTSYDGSNILSSENNYRNGTYIPTAEGRYTFTIHYGINSSSYTSTYVIIDQTTPTGEMYTVNRNTGDGKYYTHTGNAIKNIFNGNAAFASTPVETATSGAKVYARISAIGFNSYDNSGAADIYNKIIANDTGTGIEAIRTNIELDSSNILLGEESTLDNAPRYNFIDINSISSNPINATEVGATQVLGNSDQSLIYIIKLYDEAGNYAIYYYIFDKSSPYMVYQVLPSQNANTLEGIVETLENNTTQTNTNIHWGQYKAIHIANNNNNPLFKGFKDVINEAFSLSKNDFGGMFFKEVQELADDGVTPETHLYLYVPIKQTDIQSTINVNNNNEDATAITAYPNLATRFTAFVSKTKDVEELNNRITTYNRRTNYSVFLGSRNSASKQPIVETYYPDFFKGDKNYTFFVTDAFGNTTTQILTMNSSVAGETFYLNSTTNGYELINPTKQRAYNAEQLNFYYKDLVEQDQSFYAKMTYDFFSVNLENYLTDDESLINKDTTNVYYYEYCYDVESGVVYRYDITGEDGKHFKECVYDPTTKQYNYKDGASFISFEDLPDSAFFPGFPYTLSANNMDITTTGISLNLVPYLQSSIINEEDSKTKQGLYVFRRSYIDIASGNEISQDAIDSGLDENLDILKDDYAVRYHVFYIDRNAIIDLTYDLSGEIDSINSLGDLLEIYLGRDINGNQEALINAELISNYTQNNELDTNKLKVETNFTTEKYSTIEKLESYRKYQYDNSDDASVGKSFNEIMEELSRATNKTVFGYNISLSITANNTTQLAVDKNTVIQPLLVDTVDKTINSASGNEDKVNYTSNSNGTYNLDISDSSSMAAMIGGTYRENAIPSQNQNFKFNVRHTSPEGMFTTKEDDDFASVRNLTLRENTITSSGRLNTFTSSNVNNLSFTFSDSSDKYYASINPYEVKVSKVVGRTTTTLLMTSINPDPDSSYVDTFSKSQVANGALITDVFKITGEEAPYTYTINIFDKNSDITLLSDWSEDATYIVDINYIGKNPSDYTVNGKNYYYTSNQIHIDRQAPQENLKNLMNNDPNLDAYCKYKYNISFLQLSNSTDPSIVAMYKELLTTYAFPVRIIEDDNTVYYYKKEHPNNTTVNSFEDFQGLDDSQKYTIYSTYATIFNHDYDDSVNIYTRDVGDDPSQYRYSILPTEDEYNEGLNGHLKFTESSGEFYKHDYIFNASLDDTLFNFSTITDPDDSIKFFTNSHYEIIEADEAGNLTRYFVYIADNTKVEVDFNYINSKFDSITDYKEDGGDEFSGDHLEYYVLYEGTRYYISNHENPADPDAWKLYTKTDIDDATRILLKPAPFNDDDISIETEYYYHNNTCELVPVSVSIAGTIYDIHTSETDSNENLIQGRQIIGQDSPMDYLNVLNLTGIHFIRQYGAGAPTPSSKYVFDNFFTVNIYSVVGGSQTPVMSRTSDPYSEIGSGHEFMEQLIKDFNNYVKDNNSVYTYKFEIINRYSKTPYYITVNLPDAELKLNFETNEAGNLLVTIPDASLYNVKITNFSVFYYQDYAWRPMTQDFNKKIIQTVNTIDKDAGLPTTTYEFAEGQYRFYFMDNFQRDVTQYYIVGENVDSTYNFSFVKPHIQEGNTYTTSSNTLLMIDDNIWQIKIVLRDAVDIMDMEGNHVEYYDLMSSGTSTTLRKRQDDGSYSPVFYNTTSGSFTLSATSDTTYVYYYMGKLFYNEECTEQINLSSGSYKVRVATGSRLIYTLGNSVDTKKCYIITPFEKFEGSSDNIDNYEIIINWLTDPNNQTIYRLNIDRTSPTLTLMTETGLLEAINGQNYNKAFTITWRSNYEIVNARIIQTVDGRRSEITLDPKGSFEVHQHGGYTLFLTDAIGNELMFDGELGFSFNFVANANEYFTVIVDGINTLPSDYISTAEDGKTVRYYYYRDKVDVTEEVVIDTDKTKNIIAEPTTLNNGSVAAYKIIRDNINYIICYIRIIPVTETSAINNFVEAITFNYTPESEKAVERKKVSDLVNYTFIKDQDCDNFKLTVFKSLNNANSDTNVSYIGNKVYVDHYYNNGFVRTYSSDSWATITTRLNTQSLSNTTYDIPISSTGLHRFEFYDSVRNAPLNVIEVTLIKDIMFSVNEENPIDYRIYNESVVINVPTTEYYDDVKLTAKLNGQAIDTNVLKIGSNYTFSSTGIYEVEMIAFDKQGKEYKSTYNFTIINPNVTRMTFGFGNNYGFTISKVIKNNADITESVKLESLDSMWLTSGKPDSVGTYTITLLGYDKLTNLFTPFTFTVRLNNETPSISALDFQFGTKTKKPITLQYNPALIYSQVGESYIQVMSDTGVYQRIDINSESPDGLMNIVISVDGKYNVTIYNKDDNFITNYTFTKVAPLNTSAKIIIIVVSLVVIALVVTFIILRRHTKFR